MVLSDPIRVTRLVVEVFDRLQIPYFVGGSLASSLYGIPRATQDVDVVADIKSDQVIPFVRAVEKLWYVDEHAVRDAVQNRSFFNIIHLETMFKVDIFLCRDDAAARGEMERRRSYALSDEDARELFVASAEDIILHKLHWFQSGGNVAQRQWTDVLGILQVQNEKLDFQYLRRGAGQRGLGAPLAQAFREAGVVESGTNQ